MKMLNGYPIYKDSNISSIGKIPEEWTCIKIKRIVSTKITDGPHETPNLYDEGIPFLSAEAVKGGKLNFNLKRGYISIEDHERYSKKCKPKIDDIFLIKSGATTGETAIVETKDEFNIWSPLALIRCDKRKAIPKFVFYVISSLAFKEQVETNWSYGTQQNIGMGVIENLFLPLPNLDEQQSISYFLDKETADIDDLIEDKEKLIELLEEKRQAIITEAITKGLNPNVKMKDSGIEWMGGIPEHWEIKKTKHVSSFVGSGKTPRGGGEIYCSSGVIFLRSMNVHFEGLKLDDVVYIDNEIDQEMKSTRVFTDDVLLNITGASIGRTCLVPKGFPNANVNQHVCIMRPEIRKVVPSMLSKIMASQIIQDQIYRSQNGSSREGLNFSQVKSLIFPLSNCIEEQIAISKFIDEQAKGITQAIKKIKNQIEKLREFRQALIYEAVTGKIDVRDYKKVLS